MSINKKFIIFYFFILFFISNLYASPHYINEDKDIVFALEYESINNYKEAKKKYIKLFNKTKNDEYLLRFLLINLKTQNFKDIDTFTKLYKNKNSKNYDDIIRVKILSLININNLDKALKYSKILISKAKNEINYELLGNVYFAKKNYKMASSSFESAYAIKNTSESLFNLVNILYAYTSQKKEAIFYLEEHTRLYGCDYIVCSKLLSIYQEDNNLDGIISVLKKTYFDSKDNTKYSKEKNLQLLIAYLEKKDINLAINFLKSNNLDEDKLFDLYKRANKLEKAYSLAKKIYQRNYNIDYLAQLAILEFELAEDKNEVLFSVIKKFKDVLSTLNNHIYHNYLGYLLIEYNIDIKDGLKHVKQALKQAPNNIAYLDSLAWGEYKLGNCKMAKKHIKNVINAVGLDDIEIKSHWNKIKRCNK